MAKTSCGGAANSMMSLIFMVPTYVGRVRCRAAANLDGALWSDVLAWARASLFPTRGRAIVFGTVHLGVDLSKLDARRLRIQGSRVEIALPPLQALVELRPGETEVIASNLSSAETAQLLELAKTAFEREVMADPALQARARGSAERGLRGLLLSMGFREVVFVDRVGAAGAG